MKYRLDYVTNSSSSSGIVLILKSNQKRHFIKYEQFGDPGWWNFSNLTTDSRICICESESKVNKLTEYAFNLKDLEKDNSPKKSDLSKYYQSIFYYLILSKLREFLNSSNLILGVMEINNFEAYIFSKKLMVDYSTTVNEEAKRIIDSIRMIVEHIDDKVQSIFELSQNTLIQHLYDLKMDEVLMNIAEFHYLFTDYYVNTNSEIDLNSFSLKRDYVNPKKRIDPIKIKVEDFKNSLDKYIEKGCFVDELLEYYNRKTMELDNFEIMINYFGDDSQENSIYKNLSKLLGDVDHFLANKPTKFKKYGNYSESLNAYKKYHTLVNICLNYKIEMQNAISDFVREKMITGLQGKLLNALFEIQVQGKSWENEVAYLDSVKNSYVNEYNLLKEEKIKRQDKKKKESLMKLDSNQIFDISDFELDEKGYVPEKLKKPVSITIETEKGLIEVSFKPKSAFNRLEQIFYNADDNIYIAKDICYAERDYDGNIAVKLDKVDNLKAKELTRDFIKVCLLFTHKKVLMDVINKVQKKKTGELYVKRVTHIAMLDLSTGRVFYELIATNLTENKISVEIKSVSTYKSNYEKSKHEIDNKILFDNILEY